MQNLNLRCDFQWTFIVAEVTDAILGTDFLAHYKLLVDVHNKRLFDTKSQLKKTCIEKLRNILKFVQYLS